jgi:hypothetical protein
MYSSDCLAIEVCLRQRNSNVWISTQLSHFILFAAHEGNCSRLCPAYSTDYQTGFGYFVCGMKTYDVPLAGHGHSKEV